MHDKNEQTEKFCKICFNLQNFQDKLVANGGYRKGGLDSRKQLGCIESDLVIIISPDIRIDQKEAQMFC